MEIIKFDPTIEKLQAVVAATSQITATDLSDETQLALVHDTRITLRDARVTITTQGKEMRADALKYQKDVIAREKELLAIISPEEIRLKALEDQATQIKERAARAALLPMRKEQLAKLGIVSTDDNKILDLDNDGFVALLNDLTAQKNEQDRLDIEIQKAKLADEARIAQVKKDAEVAERNRIEENAKATEAARIAEAAKAIEDAKAEAARVVEEARVEREAKAAAAQKLVDDAKAEAERTVQAAKDKVAQEAAQAEAAARERAVREQQARDESLKKEAKDKFIAWEEAMGVTPETASQFKTVHVDTGIELWKLVGTYTK